MQTKTILKAIAAATLLSITAFAGATPIGNATSWTASGADHTTVSNPTSGTLQLDYYKGDYFCAGCGNNYWTFSAIADKTGTGTFDFTYNAFDAWYMATSDISFQVNGITQKYFGGYAIADTVALSVHAGDSITVLAHEYNYDGTWHVNGTVAMSNFGGAFAAVPEPTSVALLGIGLLGACVSSRKRKQA